MERNITIPEVGTILYKVCPKCNENHLICDNNCAWFGCENPCTTNHRGYEQMIVEKKFHDGWRIKDIGMIGELYFLDSKDAEAEIKSMIL